jgi:hypothetical protein
MLAKKGIILINSAGNSGMGPWKKVTFPADAEDILTVGALNAERKNAPFSGVGPTQDGRVKPDVMALGSPSIVKSLVNKVTNNRVYYPNIIDVTFYRVDPDTFSIGKGNIIQGWCSVSCDVKIGDFNVMNGSVDIGHDVTIGAYNTFMPAVRISGEVTIGEENFFGISSIVLQQIRIGDHVRVGAGSVLMTKPKNGNLYLGVPARKVDL